MTAVFALEFSEHTKKREGDQLENHRDTVLIMVGCNIAVVNMVSFLLLCLTVREVRSLGSFSFTSTGVRLKNKLPFSRLMAVDDKKDDLPKAKRSATEYRDIFAAGERKLPNAPGNVLSPFATPVKTEVKSEVVVKKDVVVEKVSEKLLPPTSAAAAPAAVTTSVPSVPATGTVDAITTAIPQTILQIPLTIQTPSASRNSMIELQAELLRLEAEREQLEIDQLRLEEEKNKLIQIDAIISDLLLDIFTFESVIVSKRDLIKKEMFFRLAELANSSNRPEEKAK